jgi:hypothetical protein
MYVNVDKVRDTDLWIQIQKTTKDKGDLIDGLKLKADDIAEVFSGSAAKEPDFVAFKTRSNWNLEDMVKEREGSVREASGFSYIRGKHGNATAYVAKLASKSYVSMVTDKDSKFEDLLARAKAEKQPKLTKEAERAMSVAAGHHMIILGQPETPLDAMGIGINMGENIDLKAMLVFRTESDAKDFTKQFDEQKKELRDLKADDGTREAALKAFVGGLTTERNAAEVTVTGKWTYSELKKATKGDLSLLFNAIRQAAPG